MGNQALVILKNIDAILAPQGVADVAAPMRKTDEAFGIGQLAGGLARNAAELAHQFYLLNPLPS